MDSLEKKVPASHNYKNISQFESEYPAFKGRMRWIRWRSQTVRRTRQGNGGDVDMEELKPNGFRKAFCLVCRAESGREEEIIDMGASCCSSRAADG